MKENWYPEAKPDWFRCIIPTRLVYNLFCELSVEVDERFDFSNFRLWDRQLLNYKRRYVHQDMNSLALSFNPVDPEAVDCLVACSPGYPTVDSITGEVLFDRETSNNPYVLLECSGDALRFLGGDTVSRLFLYLQSQHCVVTRFDLAADFFVADNPIVPLIQEALHHFLCSEKGDITVRSRMKRTPSNISFFLNPYPDGHVTENVTLGNHGSDHGMFRLYDKYFETLYGRNRSRAAEMIGDKDYWYRAEMELHREWANMVFYNYKPGVDLLSLWASAVDDYFCIIEERFNTNDHSVCSTVPLWFDFVEACKNNIDFVQLKTDVFVDTSAMAYYRYLSYTLPKVLSVFKRIEDICPGIFDPIVCKGSDKLESDSSDRYSWYRHLDDLPLQSQKKYLTDVLLGRVEVKSDVEQMELDI